MHTSFSPSSGSSRSDQGDGDGGGDRRNGPEKSEVALLQA